MRKLPGWLIIVFALACLAYYHASRALLNSIACNVHGASYSALAYDPVKCSLMARAMLLAALCICAAACVGVLGARRAVIQRLRR